MWSSGELRLMRDEQGVWQYRSARNPVVHLSCLCWCGDRLVREPYAPPVSRVSFRYWPEDPSLEGSVVCVVLIWSCLYFRCGPEWDLCYHPCGRARASTEPALVCVRVQVATVRLLSPQPLSFPSPSSVAEVDCLCSVLVLCPEVSCPPVYSLGEPLGFLAPLFQELLPLLCLLLLHGLSLSLFQELQLRGVLLLLSRELQLRCASMLLFKEVQLRGVSLLLFHERLPLYLFKGVPRRLQVRLGDLTQWMVIPSRATGVAFVFRVAHMATVRAWYGCAVFQALLGGMVLSPAVGAVPVVTHRCGAWRAPCVLGTG